MTTDTILNTPTFKHRAEVTIDDGKFSLCGVNFAVDYSSTCCDNDENGNAVYLATAGAEAKDGTVRVAIEFPYVEPWDNLSYEEKEALVARAEQCDWTRAFVMHGTF